MFLVRKVTKNCVSAHVLFFLFFTWISQLVSERRDQVNQEIVIDINASAGGRNVIMSDVMT